jgi:hypothetical protein
MDTDLAQTATKVYKPENKFERKILGAPQGILAAVICGSASARQRAPVAQSRTGLREGLENNPRFISFFDSPKPGIWVAPYTPI